MQDTTTCRGYPLSSRKDLKYELVAGMNSRHQKTPVNTAPVADCQKVIEKLVNGLQIASALASQFTD
jgi:hypothetical protein